MFNELHAHKELGAAVDRVLSEDDTQRKAAAIDELYRLNAGQKNHLTGPSGNAIGALLAAWSPAKNLSMISLNDRRLVIDYLGMDLPFDWNEASIGNRIASTNGIILWAAMQLDLPSSARTVTAFFYSSTVKGLWRSEHTVNLPGGSVNVSVPAPPDDDAEVMAMAIGDSSVAEEIRESMQIQALLAHIGTQMGFSIWLPRSDRSRVLKAWTPGPGELLNALPLGYDSTTTATIEQIDVLWLRRRSIVRAFEVEHTTSVYSGLLRMADLVALQPNINVKLHIVAGVERREKVLREIQRPVFSLLEGRALREMCTYLSYDRVREIGELKYLEHLSDAVIGEYEEWADSEREQS
ncbi:hypothetical protein LZ009_17550 [Ramlibacter sp. XY19]|uniref:hypothetical protein n=1 Tax=Ramlibacter paludis TaxID=2908000 RepID=UPI0023DA682E|nr:hypothetical protein [Ramlibacter paludis]MCG2594586.1 hypothetical protein [Ramlibacter paludis]